MKTVHEIARITGVSPRTIHFYDEIGLLKPSRLTTAGYRLYNEDDLEALQQILLFKILGFSLCEIKNSVQTRLSCQSVISKKPHNYWTLVVLLTK